MKIFGVILIMFGFLSALTQSFLLELQSGQTKCISEEIKIKAVSVGKYSVVNPNEGHPLPETHKLVVSVTYNHGKKLHYADHVESGQFSFDASETGVYLACFHVPPNKLSLTITIDLDWRIGAAANDWPEFAKKEQIDRMKLLLERLEYDIKSIHEEMLDLREREDEMLELNRSTNSGMAWLGFFSFIVCSSVAGLQLWHLKIFFERKKLL